jgi:hypothetical protein
MEIMKNISPTGKSQVDSRSHRKASNVYPLVGLYVPFGIWK